MLMNSRKIYRAVFDLHKIAAEKVETVSVDALWEWFWEQAHTIVEANDGDQFVIDLLVAVAEDIERRQLELMRAGKVA